MTLHTLIDDPVTPLLRDLEHSTLGLQKVNPKRLAGDVERIASAALALTALANGIAKMNAARAEELDALWTGLIQREAVRLMIAAE